MPIEAPHFVPARLEGVTLPDGTVLPLAPTPNNYPELPYHLRKYVLKRVAIENGGVLPELPLWNERGVWIEKRLDRILLGLPEVESVKSHEHNSEGDSAKHDATIKLTNGIEVYGQYKSSGNGIKTSKVAIRDAYFPGELNTDGQVDRWMTEHNLILINGSETRTDEEIIYESFYPQLAKIMAHVQKAA